MKKTIKQQIFEMVHSAGRPCSRHEILDFYCAITGKSRNPNYVSTCLAVTAPWNRECDKTTGYLLKGRFALTKIGYNQYIA